MASGKKRKKATKKRVATKRRPPATKAKSRRPPVVKTERRADPSLVDETLDLVREEQRASTEGKLRVGAFILERFFGGDAELARSKSPSKPMSYALLAERVSDETTWQAQDLREAVIARVVAAGLPSNIAGDVDFSYLVRLYAVDDPEHRTALARRIAAGELRGDDAIEEISRRAADERHAGRPRMPGPERLTGALEREIRRAREHGLLRRTEVRRIPDAERGELARRIDAVMEDLRDLQAALRRI